MTALPPGNADEADRIEKMANYVAKNGMPFEQVVRQKHAGNPQFSFLEMRGPSNAYYRHVLNCIMNGGWTLEQIVQVRQQQMQQMQIQMQQQQHHHQHHQQQMHMHMHMQQQQQQQQMHRQAVSPPNLPGDFSPEEEAEFKEIMRSFQ